MYKAAAAEQVATNIVSKGVKWFFLKKKTVLWLYAAARDASDGADSTDCFRISLPTPVMNM